MGHILQEPIPNESGKKLNGGREKKHQRIVIFFIKTKTLKQILKEDLCKAERMTTKAYTAKEHFHKDCMGIWHQD